MKNKNFLFYIKYLFFGIALLYIFHFESLNIGPLKVSHIWKSTVVALLILNFLINKRRRFFFYKPLAWIAILQLINIELFYNTGNAVFLFAITLILPLLGVYVLRFNYRQLQDALMFFAVFFICSFIPYRIGLLESIGDGYDLTNYGEKIEGLVGPFQNVHGASIALAGAFLIIVFFWLNKVYNRLLLSILLILGFYFLINTYVRTGMAMAAVGLVPMVLHFSKKGGSTRIRIILFSVFLAFLVGTFILSNEVLVNRIIGKNERVVEDSFEKLGSGRGLIYLTHLNIYKDANVLEMIFGMGQTELQNRTMKITGNRSLSHNGFLQLLIANGVLGLILFLVYIRNLYRLNKFLSKENRVLLNSLLLAFIVMSFFQNFDVLYFNLILILSISFLLNKSSSQKKFENEVYTRDSF